MGERRKRRRFTTEFEAEAVKRLLDGGKGLGEVATELGLSPGQLSGWRDEPLAAGSAEALAARKAEQAELQRLKRENRRLEEEVEILSGRPRLFPPGGSREPVRVRGRRAAEPRRRHAVPRRRRERQRLLRLAARDPFRPHQGRGGGRAARPRRPRLRRPPAGLRLAAGRRPAAPRGGAAPPPAPRAAGARDGAASMAGGPAGPPGAPPPPPPPPRPPPRPPTPPPAPRAPPTLLARHFVADRPGTVWLADISHLPTDEGWLYLAAIEDSATREIVGWSVADHLGAGLCVDALVTALQRRRPEPGLMHHSDRGVQGGFNWSSQRLSAPTAAPHQGPRLAFASRASRAAGR